MAQHPELASQRWSAFTALLGFGMLAVYVALIVAVSDYSSHNSRLGAF